MISRSTVISPLIRIHRTRMLAGNGHVVVQTGQKVKFGDTLAACNQPGSYTRLDLHKALGISGREKIAKSMQRHAGESLQKGDIIAQTKGFASRILRAPANCRLISVEDGIVLLELETGTLELKANYSGTVYEIIPDRGAIIESDGVLIQGAWDNGLSGGGVLSSEMPRPDREFTRATMDVSMRGSVWMSGFCAQADALQAAGEQAVKGLILSSISASLIPIAEKLPFPVIVLEGFGRIPMNEVAFKLLTTNNKREVCLTAASPANAGGDRSEVFIPLPAEANFCQDVFEINPGQRVRINMPPFTGKCGRVAAIRQEPVSLPSQINAICADVDLDNDQRCLVPITNLDMIL